MKYERGWAGPDANSDVDPLNLSLELKGEVEEIQVEKKEPTPPGSVEERMQAVERFYVRFQNLLYASELTSFVGVRSAALTVLSNCPYQGHSISRNYTRYSSKWTQWSAERVSISRKSKREWLGQAR